MNKPRALSNRVLKIRSRARPNLKVPHIQLQPITPSRVQGRSIRFLTPRAVVKQADAQLLSARQELATLRTGREERERLFAFAKQIEHEYDVSFKLMEMLASSRQDLLNRAQRIARHRSRTSAAKTIQRWWRRNLFARHSAVLKRRQLHCKQVIVKCWRASLLCEHAKQLVKRRASAVLKLQVIHRRVLARDVWADLKAAQRLAANFRYFTELRKTLEINAAQTIFRLWHLYKAKNDGRFLLFKTFFVKDFKWLQIYMEHRKARILVLLRQTKLRVRTSWPNAAHAKSHLAWHASKSALPAHNFQHIDTP